MGNRLGADVDVWPTNDWTVLSVGFIDHIELTDHVFLALDLPWAYGNYHPGPSDGFTLGNPTVGVYYATRLGGHAAFYIGGTGTPPMHWSNDGAGSTGVATTAAFARALDDLHRFLPNHVYLRMLLGFEIGVRPVFLRFDFTPVFWIPVVSAADPEFVFEHATEFEILANMGIGGGGRFQAVFFPTERYYQGRGGNDLAQLGVEPFFAYEPEPRGFFARAGVLFAVDPPLGPPFDRNNVVTIRGTLGGKW